MTATVHTYVTHVAGSAECIGSGAPITGPMSYDRYGRGKSICFVCYMAVRTAELDATASGNDLAIALDHQLREATRVERTRCRLLVMSYLAGQISLEKILEEI